MQIDREIHELEERLTQRRLKVELLARATSRRAVGMIVSPAGLLGAAGLGFLTVARVLRRSRHVDRRRSSSGKGGILGSLAGLAATMGFQLLRAQFGSPAQMAQRALAFFRRKSPGGDIRQAQHRAPFSG
ncbi:MAG TPA: hypothetical protein VNH80_12635 [Burkholderiales bacterium]|nr:hypothetical protein [Burkholderiales bacterium]